MKKEKKCLRAGKAVDLLEEAVQQADLYQYRCKSFYIQYGAVESVSSGGKPGPARVELTWSADKEDFPIMSRALEELRRSLEEIPLIRKIHREENDDDFGDFPSRGEVWDIEYTLPVVSDVPPWAPPGMRGK